MMPASQDGHRYGQSLEPAMNRSYLVLSLALLRPCHVLGAATNDFDPGALAYNLKTTVGAYAQVGRRNPAWDTDVRKCLTAFAHLRSRTNGTSSEFVDELEKTLPRCAQVQCDDPMIRYLHTRFIYSGGHSDSENASAFQQVATVLQGSDYPAIRKFYADLWAARTLKSADAKSPEITNLLAAASAHLAKALADQDMPPREIDECCDQLMSVPWWPEPTRWTCYRAFESPLTNRMGQSEVALLAKGRAYLSYGWQARGTGYADTVTDDGWRMLAERLSTAADAFEKAWTLNPRDPRLCLEMMRVELGQQQGRARMELWFQRGMNLAPDGYDLCYEKLEYLRPRWNGSIEEMVKFGRECTKNTNWTGVVRLMLAQAHYEASREIQDRQQRAAYWQQPKVWADVRFAFERFFKLCPDMVGWRHDYARYAYWSGQWQEFLNQTKLFPSTNVAFFGGAERFSQMVRTAQEQAKSK
jgi:hypothetical protein